MNFFKAPSYQELLSGYLFALRTKQSIKLEYTVSKIYPKYCFLIINKWRRFCYKTNCFFDVFFFFFSFHGGEVFRLSTPGSFAPPFRSHSGPPQNYPRHGILLIQDPIRVLLYRHVIITIQDETTMTGTKLRATIPEVTKATDPLHGRIRCPLIGDRGRVNPSSRGVITTTSHVTRGNIRTIGTMAPRAGLVLSLAQQTLFGLHKYKASYCPLDLL